MIDCRVFGLKSKVVCKLQLKKKIAELLDFTTDTPNVRAALGQID